VPVDAFVHLAGLSARNSAYQQLARLQCTGLAEVRRVDPGYLVGERRLGCWTITDEGRRTLAAVAGQNPTEHGPCVPQRRRGGRGPQKVPRIAVSDAPLLMATYRLLASLVLERGAGGQVVEVEAWEWPWVREVCSAAEGESLRV
jgi:hypothetical protein